MSTIAARSHSSMSLSAPARRKAVPAKRRTPWIVTMLGQFARRPGRALVMMGFALAAVLILANALMFQQARHPAPMTGQAEAPRARMPAQHVQPMAAARPAESTQPTPADPVQQLETQSPVSPGLLPPSRPTGLPQGQAREAAPRPPASVTNVPRTAPAAAPARPAQVQAQAAAPRDAIADLINGDMRPPGEIKARSAATR